MSMLQCEVCGGKLVGKPEGIFECEYCGIQYDTSWAKAKIQEIKGTVQVEGTVEVTGTVKVEGSANIESLLKRGNMAIQDKDWTKAKECFDQALNIDAECAEAYLCLAMVDEKVGTARDFIFKTLTEYSFKKRLQNKNYQRAKQFADNNLLTSLEKFEKDFLIEINEKNERKKVERQKAKKEIEPIRTKLKTVNSLISFYYSHTVGLKSDGTVVAVGENDKGQCNTSEWTDIVAISVGESHTVGLKSNGTVVAAGKNDKGQCNTSTWTDIVAISTGANHTIGLKSNGTVVAVGENDKGQCNIENWCDIVAISIGKHHTVGLKSNGTVVAVGENDGGQCNVSDWNDIVFVTVGYGHTVGLKANGEVVAAGKVGMMHDDACDVEDWTNIVDICAGPNYTLGLKSDGTVCYDGDTHDGQNWKKIVALSAGEDHFVGLKANRKVVAVGENDYGECDVSGWKDIIAVLADASHTFGLKSDGTVVATGKNDYGECNVSDWKLFDNLDNLEEERRTKMAEAARKQQLIEQQKANLRSQGLCQHCGGTFKGLFTKKCTNCGKEKDY